MFENLKFWFQANQKIVMYMAAAGAVAYFGYKWFRKQSRAKRLTRRA